MNLTLHITHATKVTALLQRTCHPLRCPDPWYPASSWALRCLPSACTSSYVSCTMGSLTLGRSGCEQVEHDEGYAYRAYVGRHNHEADHERCRSTRGRELARSRPIYTEIQGKSEWEDGQRRPRHGSRKRCCTCLPLRMASMMSLNEHLWTCPCSIRSVGMIHIDIAQMQPAVKCLL